MAIECPAPLRAAFPPRPVDADKYSVGTVTVIGGSRRYPHAPILSAIGARAAGAGLVQLVVPEASHFAAAVHVPAATLAVLDESCVAPRADAYVIGMGLGVSVATEVLVSRLLSGARGRFVLDADALRILAGWYGKTDGYDPAQGQEIILTPHAGEAAKLLGVTRAEIDADRAGAAKELADRYGATIVLKGPRTLVVSSDGARRFENPVGNPAMALGGMGDLLAGVIGARWAYLKGDPFTVAAAGAWLHSAASDRLVARAGDPSISNTAAEIASLRVQLENGEMIHG